MEQNMCRFRQVLDDLLVHGCDIGVAELLTWVDGAVISLLELAEAAQMSLYTILN